MRPSKFESFVGVITLFIAMLFAFTAMVQVSNAQSEAEMRDQLCAHMEREVTLPKKRRDGGHVRVDCRSRDYAIEVDRTEKWYEAPFPFSSGDIHAARFNVWLRTLSNVSAWPAYVAD